MTRAALVLCLVLATAACVLCTPTTDESRKLFLSSRALLQRGNTTTPSRSTPPRSSPVANRTSEEEPETDEGDDDEEPEELTPEEREQAREEAALAAFEAQQERRANESRRIIRRAQSVSADVVQRYLANETVSGRIAIFQNLFQNAAGVAAKFALNTLVAEADEGGRYVMRNVRNGLAGAIKAGYDANVAEAIENAFTIFQNPGDHYNLLDVVNDRRVVLERHEEGSGCAYIKRLFTDADAIAYDRGESMQFLRAFSAEEYLPLTECFLDECTGRAGACCESSRALRRGLCQCPNRGSTRCGYNIFANEPRTVWICSRRSCEPNRKCLCPAAAT